MSQVTAKLNNLRMAPRKVRAVSNLIKDKNVVDALSQLEVVAKRSSSPVAKLLRSAMANAENNNKMIKENLYIKSINVDEGVKLKRFKPKGFGRVSPIEKKTSRIRLVLAEKVPGLKHPSAERLAADMDLSLRRRGNTSQKETSPKWDRPQHKDSIGTGTVRKEGVLKGLGRRMFRRKAI